MTSPMRIRAHASMFALLVLAIMPAGGARAALFVVGPDGQNGCTHHVIESAVFAAQQSPGPDIIQITAGHWPGQRLLVLDSANLNIEGGYERCDHLVRSGVSTLSGEGASPTGSVIHHGGGGALTLRNLVITRGDAGLGGGVNSETAATLSLSNVTLIQNRAQLGGGLSAVSSASLGKQVNLYSVVFSDNVATLSGGGLFLRDADVVIAGNSANYFAGNRALGTGNGQGGGAIYAHDSWLSIDSVAPSGIAFMESNFAAGDGGAIRFSVSGAGTRGLSMANRTSTGPLEIANNAATDEGGALYIEASNLNQSAGAYAFLTNTLIHGNDARYAAAIRVVAMGDAQPVEASVRLRQSYPGDPVPPCASFLKCNAVTGSLSQGGSAIEVDSGGPNGAASLSMTRGHIYDNFSDGALFSASGTIELDTVVIGSNTAQGSTLFSIVGSPLSIRNSTIANNAIGMESVMLVAIPPASLSLFNTLVFQPTKNVYTLGNGIPATLRHLMVGNMTGLPDPAGNNIQFTPDPSFVNPSQYDFRLQPTSQATNRWTPSASDDPPIIDVDGALRPWANHVSPTPYDFGAYEQGSRVDHLFVDGFDPPSPALAVD